MGGRVTLPEQNDTHTHTHTIWRRYSSVSCQDPLPDPPEAQRLFRILETKIRIGQPRIPKSLQKSHKATQNHEKKQGQPPQNRTTLLLIPGKKSSSEVTQEAKPFQYEEQSSTNGLLGPELGGRVHNIPIDMFMLRDMHMSLKKRKTAKDYTKHTQSIDVIPCKQTKFRLLLNKNFPPILKVFFCLISRDQSHKKQSH